MFTTKGWHDIYSLVVLVSEKDRAGFGRRIEKNGQEGNDGIELGDSPNSPEETE